MALCWLETPILSSPSLPQTILGPLNVTLSAPTLFGGVGNSLRNLCWPSPGLRAKTRLPGPYSPDSSGLRKSQSGLQCRMGSGFRELFGTAWWCVAQWGHSPFLPDFEKGFHTCLLPKVVHTHLLLHTHVLLHTYRVTIHMHTQGSQGLSPEADKLPTQSGNKDAKSERRATVDGKERSETGVRSGEAGEGGIRDELQGWQSNWRNQRSGQDWGVAWMTQ